jgi:hypothetical protein
MYIVPNGLVSNEVNRIRAEVVVSYFEVMYRNLKGPGKPQKNCKDNRPWDQDLNPVHSKQKSGVIYIKLLRSV